MDQHLLELLLHHHLHHAHQRLLHHRLLELLDERDLINNDEKQQRDQLKKARMHRQSSMENVRQLLEEKAVKEDGEGYDILPADVMRGAIKDSYFISVLSCIAETPERI